MSGEKRTALYETHIRYGARMVSFGGWQMPLRYTGISPEHLAVRTAVGLFDVSHMGEFVIAGKSALDLVQFLTINDAGALSDGQAQYSAMATPQGTLVDDLLVYRMDSECFMLVVNAANITKDLEWIGAHNEAGAEVRDISMDTALLSIQGPRAAAVLSGLTGADPAGLAPFRFVETSLAGVGGTLSRTGYTGEDGFEFYCPAPSSVGLWDALLEAGRDHGIQPAGLGARDTLRLEARMLLYGADIDETTTPLEAGLGWMTRLDKGLFIGREALLAQKESGPARKLVGFEMAGREIARHAHRVFIEDTPAGYVTSGSPSISLNKNIGLAYLPAAHATPGQRFQVEIRRRLCDAHVVPTPFYRRREANES